MIHVSLTKKIGRAKGRGGTLSHSRQKCVATASKLSGPPSQPSQPFEHIASQGAKHSVLELFSNCGLGMLLELSCGETTAGTRSVFLPILSAFSCGPSALTCVPSSTLPPTSSTSGVSHAMHEPGTDVVSRAKASVASGLNVWPTSLGVRNASSKQLQPARHASARYTDYQRSTTKQSTLSDHWKTEWRGRASPVP